AQAGVSQLAVTYCNVCLEDLKNKTQLQDMGEPSLCQMCGYTICSTCLLKREWINSLFPPMGRAWMRLFIEGLENQGHVLVFERFQQLWLGQIFRHCRKQLLTKRQLLLIGGSRMTAKLMGRCVWLRECVDSLARRCLGEPESEQLLNSRGDSVEMVEQGGSSSSTARSERKVKLLLFDFDLTLAAVHVFHNLTGGADQGICGAPFAATERGQLRRLFELGPDFSSEALGGKERVEMLMTSLQKLKDQDIEIMICTKGLVGTCRKILQDCGLLVFFSHVFGNLGDCYG
ncbi:unnamed protein product, partial [Effrenium voratum]